MPTFTRFRIPPRVTIVRLAAPLLDDPSDEPVDTGGDKHAAASGRGPPSTAPPLRELASPSGEMEASPLPDSARAPFDVPARLELLLVMLKFPRALSIAPP